MKVRRKCCCFIALATLLALLLCACGGVPQGEVGSSEAGIASGVTCAKDILIEGTEERVIARYSEARREDDELVLDGTFAGMNGYYAIRLKEDGEGEIDHLTFYPNEETDIDDAVKLLNSYLGRYNEYDSESERYTWENEAAGLEVKLYHDGEAGIYPKFDYKEALAERCAKNGHQDVEWGEWDTDYEEAERVQEQTCLSCGEVLDSKTKEITSFVEKDHFTIYPYAFADRFEDASRRLNGIDYNTSQEYSEYKSYLSADNTVFYRIQDKNNDYKDIGMISFNKLDGSKVPISDDFQEDCIGCINVLIANGSDVPAVVYSTILAIDPGIEYSKAADVGQEVVDNIGALSKDKGIEHNGIRYLLYKDSQYYYLLARCK